MLLEPSRRHRPAPSLRAERAGGPPRGSRRASRPPRCHSLCAAPTSPCERINVKCRVATDRPHAARDLDVRDDHEDLNLPSLARIARARARDAGRRLGCLPVSTSAAHRATELRSEVAHHVAKFVVIGGLRGRRARIKRHAADGQAAGLSRTISGAWDRSGRPRGTAMTTRKRRCCHVTRGVSCELRAAFALKTVRDSLHHGGRALRDLEHP